MGDKLVEFRIVHSGTKATFSQVRRTSRTNETEVEEEDARADIEGGGGQSRWLNCRILLRYRLPFSAALGFNHDPSATEDSIR